MSFKRLMVAWAAVLALFSGAQAHAVGLDQKLDDDYPFTSTGQSVESLVAEFSRRVTLPVQLSEGLEGSVEIRNQTGSGRSFLDQLSNATNATWWHDGIVIYVEPTATISSKSVDIAGVSLEDVLDDVREMGLLWEQYPIAATSDGTLARVSGPERYLEKITAFMTELVDIERGRTDPVPDRRTGPKIYFGNARPATQAATE